MAGRRLVVVGLAATLLLGVPTTALADRGLGGASVGRFDRPQPGFASPRTVLRTATPTRVGLDPAPLEAAWRTVEGYTRPQPSGHPLYPGAVLSYGHQARVVLTRATGYSRLYADGSGTQLPEPDRIETRTDTIYDLASVSKLFTSVVVMQQVEAGRVDLDAPVRRYLPEFSEHSAASPYDKSGITVRQLLTHTSGFPAFLPLWRDQPDPASRLRAAVTADLTAEAGTRYLYSDLNLITLGALVTAVTGKPLDRLVADGITTPLRMRDTGYNPSPRKKQRVAATEYQAVPDRGMVWGEVHDENAWSFGGVAGHAGVFSTARDLGVLAQTMINGGSYEGRRILRSASVRQMITNENTEFADDAHGLGFELDQRWYMGGLSSLRTAGHTGYTGTSLVIDFASRSFAILLTNRVHPSRSWGSVNPARVAAAQGLAASLAVRPREGRTAWFSQTTNARSATLTVPLTTGPRPQRLSWQQLVDTEASDPLTLQVSADGGTTWTTLPYRLGSLTVDGPYAVSGERRWQRATAEIPVGSTAVRWTYAQDAALSGRGVYLDAITVRDGRRVVMDTERHPDRVVADGWTAATR
jgi:CubicO group peptidase (beta-lactamase class C family)